MDTAAVLNGDSPRSDEEAAFLAAFADHVAGWAFEDMSLKSFRVITLVPLIVVVDVPGLSAPQGQCTLQVGYWTDGPYGTAVEGQWGDAHLLDDHTYTSDGLTVIGLEAAPEVFASFAAGWLHRQLLRPVNRHDWLKGGKVVASRWQLGDSGLVLRTQAKLPALLLRTRPADVVVRER
jgi:hypothetical protein